MNTLFFVIIIFNYLLMEVVSTSPDITQSSLTLEQLYMEKIASVNLRTKKLCESPVEWKLAMCNYVVTQVTPEKYTPPMHLNKTAFSLLSTDCAKNLVIFQYNDKAENLYQYMLMCYGRHNPTESSWTTDTAFDLFAISGGLDETSITVFERKKWPEMEFDQYSLNCVLGGISVLNFSLVKINRNNVNEEHKSLDLTTNSTYSYSNEINYIRKIYSSKLEKYDPICALRTNHKISLCKKIIELNDYFLKDWQLSETMFDDESAKCIEKPLYFQNLPDYNGKGIHQKMFSCHGTHKVKKNMLWHVSAGFYDNSVIVYFPSTDGYFRSQTRSSKRPPGHFTIGIFYQNFKIENLLFDSYNYSQTGTTFAELKESSSENEID